MESKVFGKFYHQNLMMQNLLYIAHCYKQLHSTTVKIAYCVLLKRRINTQMTHIYLQGCFIFVCIENLPLGLSSFQALYTHYGILMIYGENILHLEFIKIVWEDSWLKLFVPLCLYEIWTSLLRSGFISSIHRFVFHALHIECACHSK